MSTKNQFRTLSNFGSAPPFFRRHFMIIVFRRPSTTLLIDDCVDHLLFFISLFVLQFCSLSLVFQSINNTALLVDLMSIPNWIRHPLIFFFSYSLLFPFLPSLFFGLLSLFARHLSFFLTLMTLVNALQETRLRTTLLAAEEICLHEVREELEEKMRQIDQGVMKGSSFYSFLEILLNTVRKGKNPLDEVKNRLERQVAGRKKLQPSTTVHLYRNRRRHQCLAGYLPSKHLLAGQPTVTSSHPLWRVSFWHQQEKN